MGLIIALEDATGSPQSEMIEDAKNILHRILPFDDPAYPYLGRIDPYGDTVFNQPQTELFLVEWKRLTPSGSWSPD